MIVQKKNTLIIPLLIVGILFFVIGFGVGISGFLTPFLRDALNLSVTESYLVTAAIFSAFLVFGAPAGWIIKKVGYKMSMLIAFFYGSWYDPFCTISQIGQFPDFFACPVYRRNWKYLAASCSKSLCNHYWATRKCCNAHVFNGHYE